MRTLLLAASAVGILASAAHAEGVWAIGLGPEVSYRLLEKTEVQPWRDCYNRWMNREPFATDEWYHCYNRGVDKRDVFLFERDYERFLMLLVSANDESPVHLGDNHRGSTLEEIVEWPREHPLVAIGAYCLMPNHFHILLQQTSNNGVALFMQKIGTGYTMYFNKKEERTGALFGGRFKSKHVDDDRYFKRLVNYIHANPAELVEPRWKEGLIRNQKDAHVFLAEYRYSSLPDYLGSTRPEAAILNRVNMRNYYEHSQIPNINALISDARTFAEVQPWRD